MSGKKEPNPYGLIELATGVYFDKKLNQKLILKQSYVEASGDEFARKYVAMVLYAYEGGKNRTETAEAFVQYGEENLEVVELKEEQLDIEDAIETTAKEVITDGPIPLTEI